MSGLVRSGLLGSIVKFSVQLNAVMKCFMLVLGLTEKQFLIRIQVDLD